MNRLTNAAIFSSLRLLTGCASFQANSELHSGRMALRYGMPDAAIAHLEQATALDGALLTSQLQEGPWAYLGRAYYEAKKYPQARQALERALEINRDDSLARLYLGLTLTRQGDHESSRKEVLRALQGIHGTLEHIVYNTQSGIFWDPAGRIRNEVSAARNEVTAANPHLEKLLSRLETIGASIEEEMEMARRDESRANRRRGRD